MSPKLKNLNELMDNRFSCRGFLKKEVEQKFIEQIVQVAQKSHLGATRNLGRLFYSGMGHESYFLKS